MNATKFVKWEDLNNLSYKQQLQLFNSVLSELMNRYVPPKTKTMRSNEKPWATQKLKALVSKRQAAKSSSNQELFNQQRNLINRKFKALINRKFKALMSDLYKNISRRNVQIRQQSVVKNHS